jgi:gliding motility-associated-like protein
MYNPYVDLLNTSSSDVINYSWFIPEGTPAISTSESVNVKYPETVSTYPVTLYVTNDNNCVDSVTNYVIVNNEVLFYAPNSFTPDGDEFNQVWKITIAGIDSEGFILSIYNRWGELIWESRDPSISWDGTFNGQKVPLGTYNWTLQAGDEQNDERYFFNGYVNVIK